MKLQDIFDQLTSGELRQLSIGGNEQGVIDENNWGTVLNHVNLGVGALYKRFNLKEGRLRLELVPDQVMYQINSSFAQQNTRSRSPIKYLLDEADAPFKDDILKIERVLVESNYELPLNDMDDCYSVSTPTAVTLRVPLSIVNQEQHLPYWLKTETLELVYRAAHPKLVIPATFFDPTRVDVQLPDTHMAALLYFIAARINAPMGTGQFEGLAGNTWFTRYEAECQALLNQNLQVDTQSGNTKLRSRGWV